MIPTNEIKKIAALAKLYVSEDELVSLSAQMESMIEFAGRIASVPTDTFIQESATDARALRRDEVCPSLPQDLVLKNAAETLDGFFVVRDRSGDAQ